MKLNIHGFYLLHFTLHYGQDNNNKFNITALFRIGTCNRVQAVPYIDIAKEHDQHSIQDRSPLSLIIGDRGKWLAKSIHSYTLRHRISLPCFYFSLVIFMFFCGQRWVATTQPLHWIHP